MEIWQLQESISREIRESFSEESSRIYQTQKENKVLRSPKQEMASAHN